MTKHYNSYGNSKFGGASGCVNGTDMADSVGKRGLHILIQTFQMVEIQSLISI